MNELLLHKILYIWVSLLKEIRLENTEFFSVPSVVNRLLLPLASCFILIL